MRQDTASEPPQCNVNEDAQLPRAAKASCDSNAYRASIEGRACGGCGCSRSSSAESAPASMTCNTVTRRAMRREERVMPVALSERVFVGG